MSDLDKDWMPEVGVPYKHHSGRIYEVTGLGNLNTKDSSRFPVTVIYRNVSNGTLWTRDLADWRLKFQPLKSEAEKRRDEQIEALADALFMDSPVGLDCEEPVNFAKVLHAKGCRMTRELTQDVITELYRKHLVTIVAGSGYEFARSIEAHILGEN